MYFYGSDIDYTNDAVDSISPPHISILQMRRVA